jgi:predicted DNA-binding transcriptional regulator AlpA
MMDEIWLLEETSQHTHVPKATLRYWRQIGEGPKSFRIGGRVAYKRSDIEAWIEKQYAATGVGGGPGAA